MAISSPGIGSNLDVNGIVSQLMAIERRPLTVLDRREAGFQARISAFGALKGALSSLQGATRTIADPTRFQTTKASIADASIGTVAATGSAAPGSYALEVTRLAQAQKVVAAGQASATTAIGTGTLAIDFGTISGGSFNATSGQYTGASFAASGAAAKTVTIDAAHASLSGIRDAINAAKIGVNASIVNDGGASPYRLALSTADTGASRSVRIAVSGDVALQSLLAHDPAGTQGLSETITAQNAALKIDGVAITKPTNVVTDAIEGVTLTLAKTTSTATAVTVSRDTGAIRSNVEGFVKAYNDANRALKELSAYNAGSKQGALLQGDGTVIQIQSQLRNAVAGALKGVFGAYSTLGQIGVAFQKDGSLAINATKLSAAIDAAPGDIGQLFASVGRPTDSQVTFKEAGTTTKPGAYTLDVSQLATQGTLVGAAPANLTVAAGVNDAVTVSVDGVAAAVTLAARTYGSAGELATELQSKLNGASAFTGTGIGVSVAAAAGVLSLTSNRYGATSTVSATGGNGLTDLLGGAPVGTAGVDVAGAINGQAASGLGRQLTDITGSGSAGIKVEVNGGATGNRGFVYFTRGYAAQLDRLIDSFTATNGLIAARTTGLGESIKDVGVRREETTRRLELTETRLRAQFSALDTLVGRLSSTSSFLTQQLAKLDANSK